MRYALLSLGITALGLLAWKFSKRQVDETPQALRLKAFAKYVDEVNEETRRRNALAVERRIG